MRAETYLARGDDAASEVACYKAIYQAQGARQTGIALCAELTLAKIAILRGDGKTYAKTRGKILKDAAEAREKLVARMGELCLASLDLLAGSVEELPDWLRGVESIRKILYTHGHSYGFMLHGHLLLLEGRHAELYGLTDVVMNLALSRRYLLPQVCHLIYLAVAKKKEERVFEAEEYLRRALGTALPDRVYLPFAEFGDALLPLLEAVKTDFGGEKMEPLTALCRRYSAGAASVRASRAPGKSFLTPREREIALLAKERLGVREIASRLFISENTVKSALKAIFDKLEIHSKADLAKKDF